MKIWTDEEYQTVREHAMDLMTWKDIAYLMEIDIDEFKNEFFKRKSKLYIAYQTGVVERKKLLRKPVLKMAEHGSPQAELIADKLLSQQILSELDE